MNQSTTAGAPALRDTLAKMIDLLTQERQALAGMDMELIMGCAYDKQALCDSMEGTGADAIDEECRGLLDAAKRLNEVNRQLRNLIAANVAARLEALTGGPALYRAAAGQPLVRPAYAYAGTRA